MDGLTVILSHHTYQFASSSIVFSVKFILISSQPSVAGASHLWANLMLISIYVAGTC